MQLRRKTKKRLPKRIKEPLEVPDAPREVWSADFMSDSLITGRNFRVFNLMDDFNREALCMKGNFSMPGIRVVEYLREAIEVHGKPLAIRVDNGPEFLSRVFVNYCEVEDIEIKYIQPGKPSQNGFIERFDRPTVKMYWMRICSGTSKKSIWKPNASGRNTTVSIHISRWAEAARKNF